MDTVLCFQRNKELLSWVYHPLGPESLSAFQSIVLFYFLSLPACFNSYQYEIFLWHMTITIAVPLVFSFQYICQESAGLGRQGDEGWGLWPPRNEMSSLFTLAGASVVQGKILVLWLSFFLCVCLFFCALAWVWLYDVQQIVHAYNFMN